jgi:predicted DNA-binding antitoxin AbrB/MazE fold protein
MTFHTDAIYEGGVLRPLTPLELDEHQVVALSISTVSEAVTTDEKAARQRNILTAYVAKVESRPEDAPADGFTNRDHDRLIYGE